MKDKLNEIPVLYDFYGQLLTEKQRHYLELYYYYDLSLGEISEESGTTRQAVYDIIKRSEHLLQSYEEKLQLVQRFDNERKALEEIIASLARLKSSSASKEEVIDFIENSLKEFKQI